jgi:hypothetical protein
VHALYNLNKATVKRQTTYEDHAQVRGQTPRFYAHLEKCVLSCLHSSKASQILSSHLTLPLFVNNKFIELQTGGHFVCTRPDLAPLVPSAQLPTHLRHHYNQVVERCVVKRARCFSRQPRIVDS